MLPFEGVDPAHGLFAVASDDRRHTVSVGPTRGPSGSGWQSLAECSCGRWFKAFLFPHQAFTGARTHFADVDAASR